MGEAIPNLNTTLDQSDMKGAITSFPDQIKKSFSIMNNWTPQNEYNDIQIILVLGMAKHLFTLVMDRGQ